MKKPFCGSTVQIHAYLEVVDLVSNGYQIVIEHYDDEWWYVKLRHRTNQRTLVVQWKGDQYTIKENQLILKQEGNLEKVRS